MKENECASYLYTLVAFLFVENVRQNKCDFKKISKLLKIMETIMLMHIPANYSKMEPQLCVLSKLDKAL